MKALHVVVIVAALFVAFAARSSSAQGLFSPPRPTSGSQSYFVPPPSAPRSTKPRAEIKVPQPESASIDEQYAKGSVVIINHERTLYFVEDAGRATRYPVAIGSPVDQWEGVQTITAKRENPKWFPTED